MTAVKDIYLGIDFGPESTILSIYNQNMAEPQTISTVLGAENYAIPTALAKKNGLSQWYFGHDANLQSSLGQASLVEDLYKNAYDDTKLVIAGESYSARQLLAIYFKKLLSMPSIYSVMDRLKKLIVCIDIVDSTIIELLQYVAQELNIGQDSLLIIDKKECFYYYALSQKPDLFTYNVALFEYSKENSFSLILSRNTSTKPQVVTVDKQSNDMTSCNDQDFLNIAKRTFGNKVFSAVYLVGDGFNGEWMKESLTFLCRGRKVFLGQNLYSKGACYAGLIKSTDKDWPFIYIGDNDLKFNISLKLIDKGQYTFYSLLEAGRSWFEEKGECEVIIDGNSEVELYMQKPEQRMATTQVLELIDMPERENRTTRVRIEAVPLSDASVKINITDLGFGEISPSSGKKWEHTITI